MGIVAIMYNMGVQMHWYTHDGDAPSFFFVYCGANFNRKPLDKWLKKRYNTTTLMSRSYESDHIG